jgi:hypothetical protein
MPEDIHIKTPYYIPQLISMEPPMGQDKRIGIFLTSNSVKL